MVGPACAYGSTRPGSVRPCSVLFADHGSERASPTGSPPAGVAYVSTRAEYHSFVPFQYSRLLSFASVYQLFVFASRLKRTVSTELNRSHRNTRASNSASEATPLQRVKLLADFFSERRPIASVFPGGK